VFIDGQLIDFLTATVRMAIPLLIASLGLVISERAGMMNIGVEGIMLMGAFAGYTGAKISGSYWIGLSLAILVSVCIISIFAVATITYKAKQVIVGAAINLFCAGLSSFLYRLIFHGTNRLENGVAAVSFPDINIPVLSKIPVIGEMLFSYNILVYFAFIMVAVLWIVINKTSLGLKIIAVGEHPKAANSLGVNIILVRYLATIFSGIMIGISGAYLSIAQASSFGENMSAGRGFIAMAIVILGKWNPIGTLAGALVFGGATALQLVLQMTGIEIPRNIIMMVPYIATVIVVLAVSRNKVTSPTSLGVPYEKS
jgi:general nucleoside transport system permease protein